MSVDAWGNIIAMIVCAMIGFATGQENPCTEKRKELFRKGWIAGVDYEKQRRQG